MAARVKRLAKAGVARARKVLRQIEAAERQQERLDRRRAKRQDVEFSGPPRARQASTRPWQVRGENSLEETRRAPTGSTGD